MLVDYFVLVHCVIVFFFWFPISWQVKCGGEFVVTECIESGILQTSNCGERPEDKKLNNLPMATWLVNG